MKDRFDYVIPQAPASFGYAIERALHETEVEEMNKRKFSFSLVWVMVALFVLAGAAMAVGDYFGILDYLSLESRKDEDGAPDIATEYIGAKFTAGGYDMELVEYVYEGERLTLMFAMDEYSELLSDSDVLDITVVGREIVGKSGSGYASEADNVSYFLREVEVKAGGDTETVRIMDIATGEELFAFEATRTAAEELPEGEIVILDDTIENAGITIVGCDVERDSLTTELTIYYNIEPEDIVLDVYATDREVRLWLKDDMWHVDDCELIAEERHMLINVSHAEAMTTGIPPCECAVEWMESLDAPESIDPEMLHLDWLVIDEQGIPCSGVVGYDKELQKYYRRIEFNNVYMDSLPDTLYFCASERFDTFIFNDTAAIDVSALKAE